MVLELKRCSMAKNAALIGKWFDEVWNQGREETIDEMSAQGAFSTL